MFFHNLGAWASGLPISDAACWDSGNAPRLNAVLASSAPRSTTADVIYVHGYKDEPSVFNALYSRLSSHNALGPRLSHHALCFDDNNRRVPANAMGFAIALSKLRSADPRRPLVIISHSLGGILARGALNHLTKIDPGFFRGAPVTVLAIDTPWHGFDGPSDAPGGDAIMLFFAKPFLPDGIFDMRAKSRFFRELYHVQLPRHVAIIPIFAQSGKQALDYTEEPFHGLAAHLANAFNAGTNPYNLIKEENFRHLWSALVQSIPGRALYHDLIAEALKSKLTEAQVTESLLRSFPRLTGDHRSVLSGAATQEWLETATNRAL